MLMIFRLFIATILFSCLPGTSWSQEIDYREIFGDDWKKADSFEKENRSWMEPILTSNHLSYPMAIAVIFPELVRYSALRDKMEITLLKTLYVNLGDDYANFSVGHYQMKPSFAEMIRSSAPDVMSRKSGIMFKSPADFDDIKNFRKSIIIDLEDPRTQFSYLVAFMKICEKNYKTNRKRETEKLRFLATAYNYGIDKSATQIESMINKKFFNTKMFRTENYCYADVSVFWYKQYLSDK